MPLSRVNIKTLFKHLIPRFGEWQARRRRPSLWELWSEEGLDSVSVCDLSGGLLGVFYHQDAGSEEDVRENRAEVRAVGADGESWLVHRLIARSTGGLLLSQVRVDVRKLATALHFLAQPFDNALCCE